MTDDPTTDATGAAMSAHGTVTTPRLVLTPVDEADLPGLLGVRLSNPDRLLRTDGSDGVPGHYDADMLARDVFVASVDPARLLPVVRLRSDGQIVGLVDLLTEHPEDGHPWLGAVEIDRAHQRRGYGREAAEAALTQLLPPGRPVRTSIDADDAAAQAFARHCGFAPQQVRADGSVIWQRDPATGHL